MKKELLFIVLLLSVVLATSCEIEESSNGSVGSPFVSCHMEVYQSGIKIDEICDSQIHCTSETWHDGRIYYKWTGKYCSKK